MANVLFLSNLAKTITCEIDPYSIFYILAIKDDAEMEALMLSINENNENDENLYDEDKFFVEISDQLP